MEATYPRVVDEDCHLVRKAVAGLDKADVVATMNPNCRNKIEGNKKEQNESSEQFWRGHDRKIIRRELVTARKPIKKSDNAE